MTIEDLIRRFLSFGNPEDLAPAYESSLQMLMRLCLHYFPHDAQAAEDIVQETWETVLRKIRRSLEDPDRWRGWICRIAVNKCRARHRRARREPYVRMRYAEMTATDEHLDPGGNGLAERELATAAWRRLKEDDAVVLFLLHLADDGDKMMSDRELARKMGVSKERAKKLRKRAHERYERIVSELSGGTRR